MRCVGRCRNSRHKCRRHALCKQSQHWLLCSAVRLPAQGRNANKVAGPHPQIRQGLGRLAPPQSKAAAAAAGPPPRNVCRRLVLPAPRHSGCVHHRGRAITGRRIQVADEVAQRRLVKRAVLPDIGGHAAWVNRAALRWGHGLGGVGQREGDRDARPAATWTAPCRQPKRSSLLPGCRPSPGAAAAQTQIARWPAWCCGTKGLQGAVMSVESMCRRQAAGLDLCMYGNLGRSDVQGRSACGAQRRKLTAACHLG